MPEVSFDKVVFEVEENVGKFPVKVVRKGDTSQPSSVKIKSFTVDEPKSATSKRTFDRARFNSKNF